jgi:alpha-beta hydrolase superfamily lysophospholipase
LSDQGFSQKRTLFRRGGAFAENRSISNQADTGGTKKEKTMQNHNIDALDRPEILGILFHPRKAPAGPPPGNALDLEVAADDKTIVGCRFYPAAFHDPFLLFFHGNGEIAADYDQIGPVYNDFGLNFFVADYRGYGKSTGSPTVSSMLEDAGRVLDFVLNMRMEKNFTGPLWIMGRSLGSAPALELAASRHQDIAGVIIESGFAETLSLLEHLGIDARGLGISESETFSNAEKISRYTGPALIMHARFDHIIPLEHARNLYQRCPSTRKALEVVEDANHNDIMIRAGENYFKTIANFIN